MKTEINQLIEQAVKQLITKGELAAETQLNFKIEQTKDKSHGDYACNIAMTLAKALKKAPRDIAQLIIDHLPESDLVEKIQIAGPGFINFFLTSDSQMVIVKQIHAAKESFGHSTVGAGKKIHMEYVSANPTGPLHVGHGRGAAYGATVANLLSATGHQVHREYYVNDAGRQMHILACSVWLRYLECCGENVEFPSNGYKGDYIKTIATAIHLSHEQAFFHSFAKASEGVRPDEGKDDEKGDKEAHIDDLITNCKSLLGEEKYQQIFCIALDAMVEDIKQDLAEFGVEYDNWFSEQSLADSGAINKAIDTLKNGNYLYEKDGALWFRTSEMGDDKDRVVIRENGQGTYFASDIAYHMNKLDRGNEQIIDVLGADHHGYIARVKASMQALGANPDQLSAPLIQFVSLFRGKEKVAMSTRSGSFVTLRELREEIGSDAARFFYVMRKADQAMDFDLELAKSNTDENPLFYIQYAHARICQALRKLDDSGHALDLTNGLNQLELLTSEPALALLKKLSAFCETIEKAALQLEPHLLVNYLRELAQLLHSYYTFEKWIVDDKATRDARFALITALRQVVANGLSLLGVSAPESM